MNRDLNEIGMRYYRATHPKARRAFPTAIVHNGSSKTVFECICGSRHSCATRHRYDTAHYWDWRLAHSDCAQAWIPLGLA